MIGERIRDLREADSILLRGQGWREIGIATRCNRAGAGRRKDTFFQIFTFGFIGLFLFIILERIYFDGKYEFVWIDILFLIAGVFIMWLYFGTKYELTESELKYQSGPFTGNIEIKNINEIIKGKTLWAGLRPSTARNGLIIKYGKYDEIYISPKTNDLFLSQILKINKNIKITGWKASSRMPNGKNANS